MDNRVGFLHWILGETEGFVALGALHALTGEFEQVVLSYPNNDEAIADYIRSRANSHNLYFCPTILAAPKRVKSNIRRSRVVWADLDACDPELLRIKPTITIQTSPLRYQAFWKLTTDEHADEVEAVNKRIAYFHEADGCDLSGWDLSQYLRIPNTHNHKYPPDVHDVKIIDFDRNRLYKLSDFDVYPQLQEEKIGDLAIPFPEKDPDYTAEEFLDRVRHSINPRVWSLFEHVPDSDWSKNLWQLELILFAAECTPQDVFLVAKAAACNKYERDRHSEMLLWKDVLRAYAYSQNASLQLAAEEEDAFYYVEDAELLTEEERFRCKHYRTVIDDYFDWATSVGDAAPAYHIAGAFVILSALIAGSVRLPTRYGTVVPNLWFMILADTTLTRKSTAMDLAVDLIVEIDSAAIAATDASVEGLLTTMSTRPGKPSIFLRDEFTGLLESMKRKDYMAGMMEAFTKLYDGKFQKKTLSKSTVEIRDPILIMFVGGIKSRTMELISFEHINSGFLPRFIIVTASTDTTKVRPLGPPTPQSTEGRDRLLATFRGMHTYYNPPMVPGQLAMPSWSAELTPEAWIRYNQFEDTMTQIGVNSSMPELMTPMMVRLCNSGLKAAVLLAASRQEPRLVVTELDLVKAFFYVETWKSHAIQVVNNAGKSADEKVLERIYQQIDRAGDEGIARGRVMQNFHLSAKEANNFFETLLQRGLIRTDKGRSTKLYTTRRTLVGERLAQ